jgi:hypothetical protein
MRAVRPDAVPATHVRHLCWRSRPDVQALPDAQCHSGRTRGAEPAAAGAARGALKRRSSWTPSPVGDEPRARWARAPSPSPRAEPDDKGTRKVAPLDRR